MGASYMQDDAMSVRSGASRASRSSRVSGSSKASKSRRSKSKGKSSIMEAPKKPACTPETIQAGLSQLGRTADGLRPAYLKLQVEGTDMASTDEVAAYKHLQTLVLCSNELSNIKSLSNLDSLTHLDVSGNKLANVLNYSPSRTQEVILRYADFSSNLITSIDDLSAFPRLLTLRLDHNEVERVCGLRQLRLLQRLSLASNRLLSCLGLEELASLQHLDLTGNRLVNIEPLAGLSSLEVLLLSRNQLQDLRGIESLSGLRKLDVSYNQLDSLHELSRVAGAAQLSELQTQGNPWDKFLSVRLHIINLLPQVTVLNEVPVSAKEKVLSNNMHGADAEALRAIRRKYFPNGELDDGGGAIPPEAAGLTPCQAEEERADGLDAEFLRIDAWAKSLAPGSDNAWWQAAQAVAAVARAAAAAPPTPPTLTVGNVSQLAKVASQAERIAAAAAGAAPPGDVGAAGVVPLVTLADQLASTCGASQVLLARACWQWVACHARPPRREHTWSVQAPLFGPGERGEVAELALLGSSPSRPPTAHRSASPAAAVATTAEGAAEGAFRPGSAAAADASTAGSVTAAAPQAAAQDKDSGSASGGAWAEHAAWLFVQLARACELEAVIIPGFWKNGVLPPGGRVEAHNHSWAGVKVNGRWRLVDPTAAALQGGAPSAPFFIPPEAFIYTYLPLAAVWQLLPNPISLDTWWSMPECSVPLFSRGCKLLTEDLQAVNVLPSYREGDPLPHMQISIAAPQQPGQYLSHTVFDAHSRRAVATWPPADAGRTQLAFQQVAHGPEAQLAVEFGPRSCMAQATHLYASFPGPGEYFVEVQNIVELPGGLPVKLEELPTPLALRVVQSDEVLRVKVVVPEPEPFDPEDGILHDTSNPPCLLPYTHDRFTSGRCQLVSPAPTRQLEADREETFEVVAPGAGRVAIAQFDGTVVSELGRVDEDAGGPARFRGTLQVPRVDRLKVLGYLYNDDLAAWGWLPLLTMQVLPQTQHIVELPEEYDIPEVLPDDPGAGQAAEMFRAMDLNQDGRVTRREMLVAFRHNRQHADHLKIPARIRLHDGSYDKFVERFLAIDWGKLGSFDFSELCAYMGISPAEDSEYDDEGSDYEGSQELGDVEDHAQDLQEALDAELPPADMEPPLL